MSNTTYKLFADKMGGTNVNDFIGNAGDIFYDPESTSLRISNGNQGGVTLGGTVALDSNASLFIGGGGTNNTTGDYNIAIGHQALYMNTTGGFNNVIGSNALFHNIDGFDNCAIGDEALYNNTTGDRNLALLYRALRYNTTGNNNIGIGFSAGSNITTGSNNTIIGNLVGSSDLQATVLIGAGSTERIKVDDTGLYVNESPVNCKEVTYAYLTALISSTSLITGLFYKITDFASTYDQPDFDVSGTAKDVSLILSKTGPTEPLIVLATSNNTLSPQAWSSVFPEDFITYDINHTATEIKGTSCKGRIALRKDDEGNQTPYDSRGILLKRYESSTGSGIFNSYKDNGEAFLDNIPTFAIDCENIILSAHHSDMGEAPGIDDSIFLVSNNVFGEGCESIVAGGDFYNNTFGTYAYGVQFGHWCRNNLFGESFFDCHILNNFSNNIIGNSFNNNIIGNAFAGNAIGDNFIGNNIDSNFNQNTIGIGFMNNSIGNDFYNNSTGTGFNDNHINDYFQSNVAIGNDFANNDIRFAFSGNTVLANFQFNTTKAPVAGTDFTTTIACYQAYTSEIVIPADDYGNPVGQCWIGFLNSSTALWTWSGI